MPIRPTVLIAGRFSVRVFDSLHGPLIFRSHNTDIGPVVVHFSQTSISLTFYLGRTSREDTVQGSGPAQPLPLFSRADAQKKVRCLIIEFPLGGDHFLVDVFFPPRSWDRRAERTVPAPKPSWSGSGKTKYPCPARPARPEPRLAAHLSNKPVRLSLGEIRLPRAILSVSQTSRGKWINPLFACLGPCHLQERQ